ncbi:MAG: ABC transporter permease subunit [Alphaproteobacteria bacterium]|nr:ABC transporter permease subunit [Alphaproteobacteria bacterium]
MILHIARREWTEQLRHPAMLAICAVLLGLITALTLAALAGLSLIQGEERLAALAALTDAPPALFLDTAVTGTLYAFDFLVYSQYLGFVGVIAGHALLHDRQLGTLPFLLLAPVSRTHLLAGKVLGALGPLTAVVVVLVAAGGLVAAAMPVTAGHDALAARTASWWAALLLAGPSWGAFVATATVVTSSLAHDVRLAQQAVWFVVFFVQLAVAFLITGSLDSLVAQLLAAALGSLATAAALAVGTQVLTRDLGR